MRVIPPLTAARITDQSAFLIDAPLLTSTTATEPAVGETAWASGITYAIGDTAILGAPSATVTITVASPGVVTWSANGLPNGTPVTLTTTGALPTGLAVSRTYYVVNRTTNNFQLSAEPDGAPIVTTGTQSGTHTATAQIHLIYESQVAGNSGNPPALDDGSKWLVAGATNKWAMFDLLRDTQTIVDSPLTVVITPGQRVDAIGLAGLVGDSITITVTVSAVSVYSYTKDLTDRGTTTWYGYFYGRFRQVGEVARFDLPPHKNGVITVSITGSSSKVRCGAIVLGQQVYLGRALMDAEAGSDNYSEVDRDSFGGVASMIRRRAIPTTKQQVRCETAQLRELAQTKKDLDAVPAYWAAVEDEDNGYFSSFVILGFYTEWSMTADQEEEGLQNLTLQEI
jgi:hypothetical protein